MERKYQEICKLVDGIMMIEKSKRERERERETKSERDRA